MSTDLIPRRNTHPSHGWVESVHSAANKENQGGAASKDGCGLFLLRRVEFYFALTNVT